MAREPRDQLIVDLLTDSWVASNTFDLTPSIYYASRDDPDSPHVTVEPYDEGPTGGGEVPFSFMDGSGGGPGQTIVGNVTVHAYADSGELSGASTGSPEAYLTGAGQSGGTVDGGVTDEIRRIIKANITNPTNPLTGNQPVELLAPSDFSPGPTDEETQAHYVGTVFYLYHDD